MSVIGSPAGRHGTRPCRMRNGAKSEGLGKGKEHHVDDRGTAPRAARSARTHFLVNSLSILSSLVRVNADLSEQFIDQLSRSYRYILEQKEQSLVSLRTELEFIQSYAFLLKIRFEKKFDLRFDLPDDVLEKFKIAPLTLQLLVENAVKHNRMSVKEPLVVTVSVEDKTLFVKNRVQPRATPGVSTGVGLQDIMDRYALLTKCRVWAGEAEDEFVVKVPLL